MRHPSTVTKYGWEHWLGHRHTMVLVEILGRSYVVVAAPLKEGAEAMNTVLIATGYENPTDYIGSYNKRPISGTSVWSTHSYGIAIDIDYGGDNPDSPEHDGIDKNPHTYRAVTMNDSRWGVKWQITKEQVLAVEAIRTNNGKTVWRWLGWSIGDTMHFQVNCTQEDLATGIDPATVVTEITEETGEQLVSDLAVALGAEFWETLVNEGLIEGDPAYYSSGTALPGEVSHALAVAVTALANQEVGGADEVARAEAARANRRLDEV